MGSGEVGNLAHGRLPLKWFVSTQPLYAPTAGIGLPQEKICQLILSERTGKPIDKKTLAEAFRAELDRGMALADYAVANSLFDQAVGGNVTAASGHSTKNTQEALVRELKPLRSRGTVRDSLRECDPGDIT